MTTRAAVFIVATVTKTFSFLNDSEGISIGAGSPNSLSVSVDFNNGMPPGSLSTVCSKGATSTKSFNAYRGTWAALGVPAGATVTGITLTGSYNWAKTVVSPSGSIVIGPYEIWDYASSSRIGSLWPGRSTSTADSGWASVPSQPTVAIPSHTSDMTVEIRLYHTLGTVKTNGATINILEDEISLEIEYTTATPPALTTVSSSDLSAISILESSENNATTTASTSDTLSLSFSETSSINVISPGSIVFEDTFSDTILDPTKWTARTYSPGYVNNELQSYDPSAVTVNNGNLVITATKNGTAYTSGRLDTLGKFSSKYGKIEASIQLPSGQGFWPAFWAMADESVYGAWPRNGEIDIVETINKSDTIYSTIHGPNTATPSTQWQIQQLYSPTGQTITGFHTYAMAWEPGAVHFYFDGLRYRTIYQSEMPTGNTWVFDRPFYLILNLAVGGDMPGAPDATTVFPAQMLVDYVRVYSQDTYSTATPKISTLTDDFTTTKEFNNWNDNVFLSNNQVNINALSTYPAIISQRTFDLTNSSVYVQLIQTPNVGAGSTQAILQLTEGTNKLEFGWTNNTLYAQENNNGTTDAVYPGYNAATDKYLRMRHDGTNVIWETSADATTWNAPVKTKAVTTTNLTKLNINLVAGYYGTETSPGVAIFDNLNMGGQVVVPTLISSSDSSAIGIRESVRIDISAGGTATPASYVASGAVFSTAGAASYTLNMPAGVQSGDLLLASININGNASADITAPAGWVRDYASGTDGGTQGAANRTTYQSLYVFHRIADGTEGSTVTFPGTVSVSGNGDIAAFRGVNPDTPFIATNFSENLALTNPSESLTTSATSLIISTIGEDSGSTVITIPAGWNQAWYASGGQSNALAYLENQPAGTYTATWTLAAAKNTSMWMAGIQGASGGSGTVTNVQISSGDYASISIVSTASATASTTPVSSSDTSAVSIGDTSTRFLTSTRTDTAAVSISDISAPIVTLIRSDTASVSINDASGSVSTVTSNDTAALSISEVSNNNVFESSPGGESATVSISETSSISATTNASDASALSTSDTSSLVISSAMSAVDSGTITISDSSSDRVLLNRGDTSSVSISDSSVSTSSVSRTDAATISITDVSSNTISSNLPGNEVETLSISDSSGISGVANTTDTAAISVSDSSSVIVTALTLSASDGTSVSVLDASVTSGSTATSDASALSASEVSSLAIVTALPGTEPIALSVAESTSLSISSSTNDSSYISVADTAAVVVTNYSAASDTSALSISEYSSPGVGGITNDSSSVSIFDVSSLGITNYLQVSDQYSLSVSDMSRAALNTTVTDSSTISVTDTSSAFTNIAVTDVSSLSIAETRNPNPQLPATEIIVLGISDTADVFTSFATSDTSSLAVADVSSDYITSGPSGADIATTAITENISISGSASTSDISSVGITDSSAIGITNYLQTTDTATLSIAESSGKYLSFSSTDISSVSVSENVSIVKTIAANDISSIAVNEVSNPSPILPATETISLAILETSSLYLTQASNDDLGLGVSEFNRTDINSGTIDSATVAISDSGSVGRITRIDADYSGVSITESSNVAIGTLVDSSDNLSVALTEQVAMVSWTASTDTQSLGVEETFYTGQGNGLRTSDQVSLSIKEAASVFSVVETNDNIVLGINDYYSAYQQIIGGDCAQISLAEYSGVLNNTGLPGTDSLSLGASESTFIFVERYGTDESSVTVNASIESDISTYSNDKASISISSSRLSYGMLGGSDSSEIGFFDVAANRSQSSILSSDAGSISVLEDRIISNFAGDFDNASITIEEGTESGGTLYLFAKDILSITVIERQGGNNTTSRPQFVFINGKWEPCLIMVYVNGKWNYVKPLVYESGIWT